ncbi:MAG: hypothetical protein HYU36_12405 [Planctomycetes bacterium]|nr:hypothetical protein [Planctomycetota bacterium]
MTLETRDLIAKVIDNTGLLAPLEASKAYFNRSHRFTPFTHHLGYHGIRTLYRKDEKRNLVIPFASWLNLQSAELAGIETDAVDERAWAGRGRGWPIRMEKAEPGARLSLDPLPSMKFKYSLELRPAEPDGIDFSMRFEFGRRPESGPARFRASWPCYMNAYDDVRFFYPKGTSVENWAWSSIGEKPDLVLGETVHYHHVQQGFFAESQAIPLGYGLIGERAFILMFSDPRVRLFVVNAGGHLFFSPVQNPAWDFEWVLENYPLHQPVGFDGRLLYTKFTGPEGVFRRYLEWHQQQE